ncbi:MAG: hypothetical protein H0W04_03205 [Chthoniobacterales bacterium]|nr:hypothetical protein [Chthoniobacterales bacterium]
MVGRTGQSARFCRIPFLDLIRTAGCADGEALELSRAALTELANAGIVRLRHPRRDQATILTIEVDPSREEDLFTILDRESPSDRREQLAAIFSRAEEWGAPDRWRSHWKDTCSRFAHAAQSGRALAPFSRADPDYTAELLRVSLELLHWTRESLVRFASCQLFGNSKQLEQCRSSVETILSIVTEGEIHDLAQVGILENPRSCILAGPVIMHFQDSSADLQALRGPITLSMSDLGKCVRIETPATRFCTIENPTTFHELSKPRSDTLFACSDGYAKPALRELIARLDAIIELYHFGDSDPAGFDILRHLRCETGRKIDSIHMTFRRSRTIEPLSPGDVVLAQRLLASSDLTAEEKSVIQKMLETDNKGDFEQERLGLPRFDQWPFY